MKRTPINGGSWFDRDTATPYEEDTRWNGNNYISCATGSQWNHEELFHTAGGNWVVHYWSQWQGSRSGYRTISAQRAAAWLVRNGRDLPESLVQAGAALEV